MLDIDKNSQQHQKKRITYDLTILIQDLLQPDVKQKYLSKQGDVVVYHYPEILQDSTNDKNTKDNGKQGLHYG